MGNGAHVHVAFTLLLSGVVPPGARAADPEPPAIEAAGTASPALIAERASR